MLLGGARVVSSARITLKAYVNIQESMGKLRAGTCS